MDVTQSANSAISSSFQQHAHLRLRQGGHGAHDGAVQVREHVRERMAVSANEAVEGGEKKQAVAAGDGLRTAVREAIEYERAERGTLKLRTQEGDVVRLKFMTTDSLSMQSQQLDDGERVMSEFSLDASSRTRLKIAIKGDLNAEEQKAIDDVLAQAGELAQRFFDGDVRDAFALASDFQIDSEQLARVNLRFSVQERYSYAQSVVTTQPAAVAAPAEPQAAAATPAPQAPEAPAAVSAPAVTEASGVKPNVEPAQVAVPDAAAVAQVNGGAPVAEAVPAAAPVEASAGPITMPDFLDSLSQLADALQTITGFLSQLTDSLEAMSQTFEAQAPRAAFSFSYGFKLQMVGAFVGAMERPEAEEGPMHAHDLAAQTIDELAAQSDAQLELTA